MYVSVRRRRAEKIRSVCLNQENHHSRYTVQNVPQTRLVEVRWTRVLNSVVRTIPERAFSRTCPIDEWANASWSWIPSCRIHMAIRQTIYTSQWKIVPDGSIVFQFGPVATQQSLGEAFDFRAGPK